MVDIKLYYNPGACSIAPHILLQETKVPFQAIEIKMLQNKFQFSDTFHLLNPKMKVPVLCIDGEVVTEATAIMTAISGLAPEKHLMGRSPMDTVRVYEWLSWLSGTLHSQAFGSLIRPERYSEDTATYESIKMKGLQSAKDCYKLIDEKLQESHAVGDYFTAADAYLFVFFRWGNQFGVNMAADYPKYTALVSNLVLRPSVKAILEFEGVTSTL